MLLLMTLPPWVPGQEIKPAPMPLLLVQSFVNTWDGDHGSDLLLDPAAARDWLTAAGLWSTERVPDPAELHLARGVREGIRALLAANNGGPRPTPGDLQPMQDAAHAVRPALQVGPGGQVSLGAEAVSGPDAGLLALLLAIRDAQHDGTWPRLKACSNPDCRWAFYDRSHSRAGTWCDMATCGNRIKNRRLRRRLLQPGIGDPDAQSVIDR
jgi:predicted RNA-binding Zn ribbon-like protein